MINLLKIEHKKFSNTYIYIVSACAMLLPLIFTSLVYYSDKTMLGYDWVPFTNSLHLFYGVFLSALLPSFVGIFSLYHEFKEGTIKNVLFSGYDRKMIIISKMVSACLYIIGLYAAAAVLTVLAGVILGFETSFQSMLSSFLGILAPGVTSILFIPLMAYLTLLFKSFIPPMVIAFMGTIGSVVLINMGNSFYYPWLVPSSLYFRIVAAEQISIWPPLILCVVYFVIFSAAVVWHFYRMDFDNRVC